MKNAIFLVLAMLAATAALAGRPDQKASGILPGEPDPNSGPSGDHGVLIDDRVTCPPGTKRYQRMKCEVPDAPEEDCANFAVVLDCRKAPQRLKCKAPKVPMPVYQCVGSEK